MFLMCGGGACTQEDTPSRRSSAVGSGEAEVDCTPVLAALARVRTPQQQAEAIINAGKLRQNAPHDDIPISELVVYFAPVAGEGRATDPGVAADVDLITTWMLCDSLTREIVTRQYLGDHPEHRR